MTKADARAFAEAVAARLAPGRVARVYVYPPPPAGRLLVVVRCLPDDPGVSPYIVQIDGDGKAE